MVSSPLEGGHQDIQGASGQDRSNRREGKSATFRSSRKHKGFSQGWSSASGSGHFVRNSSGVSVPAAGPAHSGLGGKMDRTTGRRLHPRDTAIGQGRV